MKKTQLFLLHFAGGNCYSFQFLYSLLHDFDVVPLELPGRGKRMGEPLITDFDSAARDIYDQLLSKRTASTFLIYGHSLGAFIALRVASMLEKSGSSPACLVVSGNAGPGIEYDKDGRKRYQLGRREFVEELRTLGGIPEEVLENEELFAFFEPILRADFRIADENGLAGEPALNIPLFAMMGSQETDAHRISNWGRYTKAEFNSEVLEGDHFFIYKHPRKIAAILGGCLSASIEKVQ